MMSNPFRDLEPEAAGTDAAEQGDPRAGVQGVDQWRHEVDAEVDLPIRHRGGLTAISRRTCARSWSPVIQRWVPSLSCQ